MPLLPGSVECSIPADATATAVVAAALARPMRSVARDDGTGIVRCGRCSTSASEVELGAAEAAVEPAAAPLGEVAGDALVEVEADVTSTSSAEAAADEAEV